MTFPAVQVEGLTLDHGNGSGIHDVTFTVEAGRVCGLLGANGAGKSTVMRSMVGLCPPERGTATFAGQPYHRLESPARHVGVLLDAVGMHPGRTARGNLTMVAAGMGVPRDAVDPALASVGLAGFARRRTGALSTGMRRRLALAAALLGRPSVVVLDEPANGLDPEGMDWLHRTLRTLADRGTAVLVSSHLLNDLEPVLDDVVVLAKGRVVEAAASDEFVTRHARPLHLLEVDDPDTMLGLLERCGASVENRASVLRVWGLSAHEVGVEALRGGVVIRRLEPWGGSLVGAYLNVVSGRDEIMAGSASVPRRSRV